MTLKKLLTVLSILIALGTVGKFAHQFTLKVDKAFAFIEKTDRRHTQEDLIFLEKRLMFLNQKRDMGDWHVADVDEMIRLQNQIQELKKELGYL